MNKNLVSSLICTECGQNKFAIEVYVHMDEFIECGRLICLSCQTWYRVENGILDFLPLSLRREDLYKEFALEHDIVFKSKKPGEEEQKSEQIKFFAEGTNSYEEEVTNSPYFMALDEVVFTDWIERNVKHGSLILDVGCGTGRQTIPLVQRNIQVISADISEEMLLLAREKLKTLDLLKNVDFIVCDSEKLPFTSALFDGCIMTGALHHFNKPEIAIQGASRVMKEKGVFFSYDPHESKVRFIFDFMMRIWKLYDEEASDDPLFTEGQLLEMLTNGDIKGTTKISTYLPPHLFYFFRHRINIKLLKITDAIFGSIPFVRKLGGMVIAEGTKIGTGNK